MNGALARLRAGKAVRAIWLTLGSVPLAEIAAESAPDVIVLDGQHGSWDRATLAAAIAAAAPATPLVRVAANLPYLIGDALDAGAMGVIVPLVESAEAAAAAVAAAHFPPRGTRSGGGHRPLRAFADYVAASATDTLVAVMIETRAGRDHAAAIAATAGVDLVFVGPGDLALSIGQDALEPAIVAIAAAAAAAGVPCGVFTSTADAARRIAEGFAFVIVADDINLARKGFADALAHARREP